MATITAEFSENPFAGIFAKLREEGHGNPLEAGLVLITSPTECHEEYPLTVLLEYTDRLDKCFWNFAKYEPTPDDAWLQFDFRDRRIALTAYTIRSGGSSHPKSWSISGSGDGEGWVTLHEVADCCDLDGPRKTKTFRVDASGQAFRYLRYAQAENDSRRPERKWRINIKAIEFFSTLSY
jgi:hypothetical protein